MPRAFAALPSLPESFAAPKTAERQSQASPASPVLSQGDSVGVPKALPQWAENEAVLKALSVAKSGDRDAALVVALAYDLGLGMRIDHAQALEWLLKAAKKGQPLAMAYLEWRDASGYGVCGEMSFEENGRVAVLTPPIGLPPYEGYVLPSLTPWVTTEGGGCRPRFRRIMQMLSERADCGDPVAMANMAHVCRDRFWGVSDLQLHVHWLRSAARLDDIPSVRALLDCYANGHGVARDHLQVRRILEQGTRLGDDEMRMIHASVLLHPSSSAEEHSRGVKVLEEATEAGSAAARNMLIFVNRYGMPGVYPAPAEARRLATEGVLNRQLDSMLQHAEMLSAGEGGSQNLEGAYRTYEQCAKLGSAEALCAMASMRQQGKGTIRSAEKAMALFEEAAGKGYPRAMRELGNIYENGIDVPVDMMKAFEWYEKAARLGEGWSQDRLGWMLRHAKAGPADNEEAVEWFRASIAQGEPFGRVNLAYHLINGLGVPKDEVQGFEQMVEYYRTNDTSNDTAFNVLSELMERDSLSPRVEDRLYALIRDPSIMKSEGMLPEVLLSCLELLATDEAMEHRVGLIAALSAAKRPQSDLLLCKHLFAGAGCKFDPDAALKHATRLRERGSKEGEVMEAAINSVAGATEEIRKAGWKQLDRLAYNGIGSARQILARRQLDAEGMEPGEHRYDKWVEAMKIKKGAGVVQPKPSNEVISSWLSRVGALKKAGKIDAQPAIAAQVKPVYPRSLRKMHVSGEAIVSFIVNVDGRVTDVQVLRATHPFFGEAARRAVAEWLFIPGLKQGEVVRTRLQVPVVFNVANEADEQEGAL